FCLYVPGPEDNNQADPPPGPKEPLNLQCSIVSNPERESCPRIPSVHWFRGGSPEARPSFVYVPGGSSEECGNNTVDEDNPPQKCLSNFCKDVSSSDTDSYYCAVATCGQILFGRATRQDNEEIVLLQQKSNTLQCILAATVSIGLVVISFLVYFILKKKCKCHQALSAEGVYSSQQCQQTEDSLVYCSPRFNNRNGLNERQLEEETVYSHVRTTPRN
uniref:Ig-like domain-containing protein n=1 Tax=Cynoglossus semilaevis TaxID=244447 RepID=A0A3P8UTB8_CYNSE